MNDVILKELLSEVLVVDVTKIYEQKSNARNIAYFVKSDITHTYMNIYELAHKCKEWSWEEGYVLTIIPFCVEVMNLETGETKTFRYSNEDMQNKIPFLPKYEFLACQWILDNKDIK